MVFFLSFFCSAVTRGDPTTTNQNKKRHTQHSPDPGLNQQSKTAQGGHQRWCRPPSGERKREKEEENEDQRVSSSARRSRAVARGSDGGFKGDSPLMGVVHPSGHASGR